MRYWTTGPDKTQAATRERLHLNQLHIKEYGFGDWAVILKEGRQFIGFCGLQHQHLSGRSRVGIGYAYHKLFWRQGYGTEAGLCVTDYAFSKLGLEEVIATVDVQNKQSRGLLEKCGFTFDHEAMYDGFPRLIYRTTRSPIQRQDIE